MLKNGPMRYVPGKTLRMNKNDEKDKTPSAENMKGAA